MLWPICHSCHPSDSINALMRYMLIFILCIWYFYFCEILQVVITHFMIFSHMIYLSLIALCMCMRVHFSDLFLVPLVAAVCSLLIGFSGGSIGGSFQMTCIFIMPSIDTFSYNLTCRLLVQICAMLVFLQSLLSGYAIDVCLAFISWQKLFLF